MLGPLTYLPPGPTYGDKDLLRRVHLGGVRRAPVIGRCLEAARQLEGRRLVVGLGGEL